MSEDISEPRPRRTWVRSLFLILVVWVGGWFLGRALLAHELANLRKNLAEQGTTIACANESWSGFPFRYTLTCTKPKLAAQSAEPAMSAQAEELTLAMWFPYPFYVSGVLNGPTLANDEVINHAPATASLSFGLTGNWSAAGQVRQVSYPALGDAQQVSVTGSKGAGLIKMHVDGETITAKLADRQSFAIDQASATAEADARLAEAERPFDLMAEQGIPFKVDTLSLASGAASITANGEMSLDRDHKITGKLASDINDIDALMVILANTLQLKEGEVAAAKTVIGLIGGDPNSKARKLDIIAKSGELYFGPFKFADVPPLQ